MERPAASCALQIGSKLPYFSLKGTDEKIYSSSYFEGAKCALVVFTCNHCPYARGYETRLAAITRDYAPEGLRVVSINANDSESYPEESFDNMVAKSTQLDFPYPYLQDVTQIAAKAFDAACTPECYLFNDALALVYHGAIDDNHLDEKNVSNHFLRDAIQAVLLGNTPEVNQTSCIGCTIKWKT